MNLILITKTAIIEKIFTLICRKLGLSLIVKQDLNVEQNVDFIIVDEEYIGDDFNKLRSHTKKLAAITSDELPFDKTRDFIIKRPFLPNSLESLLKEQIEFIKEDEKSSKHNEDSFDEEEMISSYVESLADDVADTIEDDNDESIITIASLNNGGVLDNAELLKINSLLGEDAYKGSGSNVNQADWKDINEIIDDALTEVKEYEFDIDENEKEPIRLLLNNYNISELKPFLQKFDQSVIDRLSTGEDVDVTLSLKVNR